MAASRIAWTPELEETGAERARPPWGEPLAESDYEALGSSWITREIADAAMLRRVDDFTGRDILGQKKRDCAGIAFLYYWPGEPNLRSYRIRRDNPDYGVGKDGRPKPERKYLAPPGGGNRIYVPPGITLDELANVEIPIALVEGEKKALALLRLARHESTTLRFIPIAIAGVWNWRGVVAKIGGPKGERIDVKGPIPDLGRIVWKGRIVYIVFDADVATNGSVRWARKGIARELAQRNAGVRFVNIPENCGAKAIDDLLVLLGPERAVSYTHLTLPTNREV